MKISIASGKGGTGKTTIATNLAYYLAMQNNDVIYADCDVEEPNGHIFLNPEWDKTYNVQVKNPKVDFDKCDYCGVCSEFCQFNALAVLNDKVLTFPSLCHSCGGCSLVCPQKAIYEIDRTIGEVKMGHRDNLTIYEGRLNVRETLSPPVISFLKNILKKSEIIIIDAPPGTSCPVVEAIKETDYVILVTEPTPFGLNDLILAVDVVNKLNLPLGVIINRNGIGDDRTHSYCRDNGIEILLEIPNDRRIAEAYSDGQLIVKALPEYQDYYDKLIQKIKKTHIVHEV